MDTSIELDGEKVDGFRIVSREVIEVALRDELHYLKAFEEKGEDSGQTTTLCRDGFNAQVFFRAIEDGDIGRGLL